MFSDHHYVVALRWKRAEQRAVNKLYEEEKLKLTPLLEITAKRPPPPKDRPAPKRPRILGDWMTEMANAVSVCWGTLRPAFAEVVPEVTDPLSEDLALRTEDLFRCARQANARLVPVVRLSYEEKRFQATKQIIAHDKRGACIRLTRVDLADPMLGTTVADLLRSLAIPPEEADLIVDLHLLDKTGFDLLDICNCIPHLHRWRTFTVLGGSYPSGLAKSQMGFNSFPRYEWIFWTEQIKRALPRKPAYGDYATVHPVPYNPDKHPPPCANIRYTTSQEWRVYKGLPLVPKKPESNEPSRYQQFPAIANRLLSQSFYSGAMFSEGDKYINRMAEGFRSGNPVKTGNSETWLFAAVNHHLTYVVIEIDKLFSPSNTRGRASGGNSTAQPLPPAHGLAHDSASRVLLLHPNARAT